MYWSKVHTSWELGEMVRLDEGAGRGNVSMTNAVGGEGLGYVKDDSKINRIDSLERI